jgi:hypothetical protein
LARDLEGSARAGGGAGYRGGGHLGLGAEVGGGGGGKGKGGGEERGGIYSFRENTRRPWGPTAASRAHCPRGASIPTATPRTRGRGSFGFDDFIWLLFIFTRKHFFCGGKIVLNRYRVTN